MKLFSTTLELRLIKTICDNTSASSAILGNLREDQFHTEAGSRSFKRINNILAGGGEMPSFDLLAEDPILPESSRNTLKRFKKSSLKQSEVEPAVKALNKYSTTRKLLMLAEKTVESLQDTSVDVDNVLNDVSDMLTTIRAGTTEAKMWKFGVGNNTSEVVKQVLSNKGIEGIPTFFKTWDDVNGKIPSEAVFMIGGPTGGGKSQMAATICMNMAENGLRPAILPLEMSVQEMTARLMSAVSKVPVNKVIQGESKLTQDEMKLILKTFKQWIEKCKSYGGTYMLFEPGDTPTMTQALYSIKPYAPDAIIIDYVALLDGVDGDDDWRQLANVVKEAKRFAKKNKTPVIIVAQLSEEGSLRYSKRMLDHCDMAWFWKADEEAKESGIIRIRQAKARNMDPFPFELFVEWGNSYIRDLTEDEKSGVEESDDDEDEDDEKPRKKKKATILRDVTSAGALSDLD